MTTLLERSVTSPPHRIDVDEYYRLAEIGVLSPKSRVELIEGEVVDMAPIGSDHGGMTIRLTRLVARALANGSVSVSVQGPLRLDRHSEPQPDVMLLRPRPDFYRAAHPTPADVLLLVEVADSSLDYDRGPKLDLYARHDVPEVWIVDLPGRALEVCKEPGPDGYRSRERLTGGTITPALVPDLAIDLAALLA